VTLNLTIIGRAERADLPVKIDTGADASAIWAHATNIKDGALHVVFFGESSAFYTGKVHVFEPSDFVVTRVANSFGTKEIRYKIKLRIKIKGKLINGTFTLSDRSQKLYPILIGRRLLARKFLVDVSVGSPLKAAEEERKLKLQKEMEIIQGKAEL
jgi:hypothetical protein